LFGPGQDAHTALAVTSIASVRGSELVTIPVTDQPSEAGEGADKTKTVEGEKNGGSGLKTGKSFFSFTSPPPPRRTLPAGQATVTVMVVPAEA
jgi:hypothetical protein